MKIKFFSAPGVTLLFFNGKQYTIRSGEAHYDELLSILNSGDLENQEERILGFILTKEEVERFLNKNKEYKFELLDDGTILLNGKPMANALAERVKALRRSGEPVDYLIKFLERVSKNPIATARDELWEFLDHNNLPITERGTFLAYKKVRSDWLDCHSGKIDNTPGKTIPRMPWTQVDTNRANKCSVGYHFASFDYMGNFGGDRVIIVEIDPADVAAFPTDYNYAKGRCVFYKVLREINLDETRIKEGVAVVGGKKKKLTSQVSSEKKTKLNDDLPKRLIDYLRRSNSIEHVQYTGTTGKNILAWKIGTVPKNVNFNTFIDQESRKNPEIKVLFDHYKPGRSNVKNPVNPKNSRYLLIRLNEDDTLTLVAPIADTIELRKI